jgi:hypothetical protein
MLIFNVLFDFQHSDFRISDLFPIFIVALRFLLCLLHYQEDEYFFDESLGTQRFTFSFRCLAWLTFWFITAVIQFFRREFRVSSSVWHLQLRGYSSQLTSGFLSFFYFILSLFVLLLFPVSYQSKFTHNI